MIQIIAYFHKQSYKISICFYPYFDSKSLIFQTSSIYIYDKQIMIMRNQFQILFFLLLLLTLNSMRIPCEYINDHDLGNTDYFLSERQEIVSTLYDFPLIIDGLDKTVSKSIKDQGTWHSQIIHLVAYFMKPGFHVLNLGSQSGLQAILIGKLIGSSGKLFIFEPYSFSYGLVKKNIFLNDLQNISRIYQVGAGDSQTTAQIIVDLDNTGGAQIYLSGVTDQHRSRPLIFQQVQVDLVDEVLPQTQQIDFVLMDVQKMEVQALIGMKKVIERSPNIIILLQWQYSVNPRRNEAKALRILQWLQQKQFIAYEYIENDADKCSVGTFKKYQNLKSLMNAPVIDFLLIPNHIDPATYPQV